MNLLILFVYSVTAIAVADQDLLDYLAENIKIEVTVIDNFRPGGFDMQISLHNSGPNTVVDNGWEMYFSQVRMIEPSSIHPNGTMLGDTGMMAYHINGYLFKFQPTSSFPGLPSQETVLIPFMASSYAVARSDFFPNWYFAMGNAEPRTIQDTMGDDLAGVESFTNAEQYKRRPEDTYEPYDPEKRYSVITRVDLGKAPLPIIPTPVEENLSEDNRVAITEEWVIVQGDPALEKEAQYLADKLELEIVEESPSEKYIILSIGEVVSQTKANIENAEAYQLHVDGEEQTISIVGNAPAGVFWGTQSLLVLHDDESGVQTGIVTDHPRYAYRGMHVDVSRNFHPKEDMKKLMELMSTYKLNKLHFHLTDDDGWRLEIPGLPELTDIGGKRCHDLDERTCILSQLGSGPGTDNRGSGFYTVEDYQELLGFASDRHIEVIPEFDMPGHGHSQIKAMEARYWNLKDINLTAAEEYLLTDFGDTSDYISAQYYTDNAMNPCMESTYRFVEHLVSEVKKMHESHQPLKVYNFGGDEVPSGAWEQSPECETRRRLARLPTDDLQEYFVTRVADIVAKAELDIAGWEDGLMKSGNVPYNRTLFPTEEVYAYAWNSVWYWGGASRTYILANADYKTIISHATYLYFDMPNEHDPEERGNYWATRYIDTGKAFRFRPDSVYDNIDVDDNGNPVDKDEVCDNQIECVPLEPGKDANIIGIQAQLWSEMVRTWEQFEHLVFPRFISLAERAWHKADWEEETGKSRRQRAVRQKLEQSNWEEFANTLGYRELNRLDKMGVHYQIPPPGVRIDASENNELQAKSVYPGLNLRYSIDEGETWDDYEEGLHMEPGATVYVIAMSADGQRQSRIGMVKVVDQVKDTSTTPKSTLFIILTCIFIIKEVI